MQQSNPLKYYNIILIRYSGEIWLKSIKVKMRMIKTLINNIKKMFDLENIPYTKYQLSKDAARILFFFKNEDISKAIDIFKRIFGIYSISPALRTSSNMKNISEKTIDIAKCILIKGDTFALRVKRSGNHNFKSQDVAKEVGKKIIDNFQNLKLKVDLSNPNKRIFIEVRNEFTYIFTDIIKSEWEGLPIEHNKKIIVMDIGRQSDLLAGFFLMRRGCVIYPILFDLTNKNEILNEWIFNWNQVLKYVPFSKIKLVKINLMKVVDEVIENHQEKTDICAICRIIRFEIISKLLKDPNKEIKALTDGINNNHSSFCNDVVDLQSISLNYHFSNYPIFTPLIGLELSRIQGFLIKISKNLNKIDYCKYKPKNQQIDIKKLKKLYSSLKIRETIKNAIDNLEEIAISSKNSY